MKKLYVLIALLLIVFSVEAQKVEKFKAKKVADEFCSCTKSFEQGMPASIKTMFMEYVSLGEEKAMENFMQAMMAMSETEQKSILEYLQGDTFKKHTEDFKNCIDTLKTKYGVLDEDKKKALQSALAKMKDCQFATELVKSIK
ncbi:MAG: hypothetical protein SFU27_06995 [Thermonemataceae bacterium]|nr:hypothetical protein [Thermonemataceae bacterium]